MNTNFFNQIAQLDITGQLHLIIAKAGQGNLVVSVLPKNDACGDNAKNIIMPYNLTGTAQELDERFFENITAPVKAASGLMCNMAAYMKQLEVAQRQSAMEKGKADKEKKEQDTKERDLKTSCKKWMNSKKTAGSGKPGQSFRIPLCSPNRQKLSVSAGRPYQASFHRIYLTMQKRK